MDDKTKAINEKLSAKMEAEYIEFLNELEGKTPKEIMDAAYEKVFKADLLITVQENELPYDKAKVLLGIPYPLDAVYQSWLKRDLTYMHILKDCVDSFARDICDRGKERDER